jgi:hypothetical protein
VSEDADGEVLHVGGPLGSQLEELDIAALHAIDEDCGKGLPNCLPTCQGQPPGKVGSRLGSRMRNPKLWGAPLTSIFWHLPSQNLRPNSLFLSYQESSLAHNSATAQACHLLLIGARCEILQDPFKMLPLGSWRLRSSARALA